MIRRAAIITCIFLCSIASSAPARTFDDETIEFARRIRTKPLSLLGAQYRGRIAILDTLAREDLVRICGKEGIDGRSPTFSYLELYFNSGKYLDKPLILVSDKRMKAVLGEYLEGQHRESFRDTNRLPPAMFLTPETIDILLRTGRATREDIRRVGQIPSLLDALGELSVRGEFYRPIARLTLAFSAFVADERLRILPRDDQPWGAIDEALVSHLPGTIPAERQGPREELLILRECWRTRNYSRANQLIDHLGDTLAQRAGEYPSHSLRRTELLYNRTCKATVAFIAFAAATVVLIVAVGTRGNRARRIGLGLFALSTLFLFVGFVVRWILSGRAWYLPPIMNQFEAVTGSALLGCLVGLVLELLRKKNYFALTASLYATVALLCGFFMGERMGAGIGVMHGILHSPIMGAHVAFIIVGHALVGMTFFTSLIYLLVWPLSTDKRVSSTPDLSGQAPTGALAGIDRCNLIVAQLACWTLVVGTVLGAYWADFAWARPWGWDPKETWALITTLIYVAIVHVRFAAPQRHRGIVTAVLCMLGCAAMLFNWIVVNYLLTGLHSYA